MCIKRIWIISAALLLSYGCSTTSKFNQGKVSPKEFYAKFFFSTAKSLILVPCELNGETKNFIFDTGAEVTNVQRDSVVGEIVTVRGSSNRTVENGSETIKSLKIKEVEFTNTFATNGNEAFLKEQIPNYGGVLGRTVIDKANWLINYPARTVELSDKDLSDDSYMDIPLVRSSRTPYTFLAIDGKAYRSIIDLGSTSRLNVPEDTELAKVLLSKYKFTESKRERYSAGGNETITELIGTLPFLKIGASTFENIRVNINQSSQIRLGMAFFDNYLVYIDNTNHRYRIKQAQFNN